jgi:hypothetical protein
MSNNDLRHKERLVAGDNWTVNDKEDIYSGVIRIDAVKIVLFLGELYGLSSCSCDIVSVLFYEKIKKKDYVTAGYEFGAKLQGKNLIIDKSLYGSKISAAGFHEHSMIRV